MYKFNLFIKPGNCYCLLNVKRPACLPILIRSFCTTARDYFRKKNKKSCTLFVISNLVISLRRFYRKAEINKRNPRWGG